MVSKLSHRPAGGVELHYPDFSLKQGEMLSVVGPSGSGKTTLLHLLSGLIAPQAGEVRVAGQDLSTLGETQRDRFRAKTVGYVFQDFHLLEGYTALENVTVSLGLARVPLKEGQKRAREVLSEVGLAGRLNHTPAQLSTGERQRVAIARALVNHPKVLLADEPTAHLDGARSRQVMELLLQQAKGLGATLVVVTHDPLVAEFVPDTLQVGGKP